MREKLIFHDNFWMTLSAKFNTSWPLKLIQSSPFFLISYISGLSLVILNIFDNVLSFKVLLNLNFRYLDDWTIFEISKDLALMLISVILNKFSNSTGCFPHLSNKSILISVKVLESAPESFL